MIKLDLKSDVFSAEELEHIINNAPTDDANSEELTNLVFEKDALHKWAHWIVIVVFSQVSSKDMLAALIANKNKDSWTLTDLVNETDLAMGAFQYVGNMAKWEKTLEGEGVGNEPAMRANAPGKFCRTHGRGQWDSGFTEEGMEFYHRALSFFKAIQKNKSYFILDSNVKSIWNESPRWRAKRREADASINRTARKAKPVVHEQDVPEVCSEFGRLIYGDDESDIEDRASPLRRVANKSSDLLDSDAMLSESSGINSGASDMDGSEDEEDED